MPASAQGSPPGDRGLDALVTRTTGAPLQLGHDLQLLRDSSEHEAATLAMVASARHHILIENYRICDDAWGRALLAALVERARAGVRVCVLCDWLGSFGQLRWRWPRELRAAGGEFHRFNVPGLGEPLAWVIRNHRKLISVDTREAIITGWCLSAQWRGRPGEGQWRDTGVRVAGPVVHDAEAAFARTWALAGGAPLAGAPEVRADAGHEASPVTVRDASVRLIVGRPQSSPLFRLDQLIINLASERIWLTDAYPVGTPAYLDGLRQAARAGVDVRLLVPGSSDLPLVGMAARSSYRPLLEAGVRVFEWNGPMLHAKTAVVDSYWARIGSSNLNPASWLGNYELDLAVEDEDFAATMEWQYLQDLDNATEIVLHADDRVRLAAPRRPRRRPRPLPHHQGSATTLRVSRAVALAVRESRRLGPTDAALLGLMGGIGLLFAALLIWQPDWVAWPMAIGSTLVSLNLLRIALRRYRRYRRESGD